MSYVVFVELGVTSILGCIYYWDLSSLYWPDMMCNLTLRVLLYFGLYCVTSPAWLLLAVALRPLTYVRLAVTLFFFSCAFTHAAMYWTGRGIGSFRV